MRITITLEISISITNPLNLSYISTKELRDISSPLLATFPLSPELELVNIKEMLEFVVSIKKMVGCHNKNPEIQKNESCSLTRHIL